MDTGCQSITQSLKDWRTGDHGALDRLAAAVYSELRRVARGVMVSHGQATIIPTELVHELYLRLPNVQQIDFESRIQFLNCAASMMRNILVDHARRRFAAKRGGKLRKAELNVSTVSSPDGLNVLEVHEALGKFATSYPRQARVVELRFFGGLSVDETRDVLISIGFEASTRTVERDWTFAKAWLQSRLMPRTGD